MRGEPSELEWSVGMKMLPSEPRDLARTRAATVLLKALTGSAPETPIEDGIGACVDWYRGYTGG